MHKHAASALILALAFSALSCTPRAAAEELLRARGYRSVALSRKLDGSLRFEGMQDDGRRCSGTIVIQERRLGCRERNVQRVTEVCEG